MGIIFIASFSLSVMAALIGIVLTEFTDAFWDWVDSLASRAKRIARDKRGHHRHPRHVGIGKHTGR